MDFQIDANVADDRNSREVLEAVASIAHTDEDVPTDNQAPSVASGGYLAELQAVDFTSPGVASCPAHESSFTSATIEPTETQVEGTLVEENAAAVNNASTHSVQPQTEATDTVTAATVDGSTSAPVSSIPSAPAPTIPPIDHNAVFQDIVNMCAQDDDASIAQSQTSVTKEQRNGLSAQQLQPGSESCILYQNPQGSQNGSQVPHTSVLPSSTPLTPSLSRDSRLVAVSPPTGSGQPTLKYSPIIRSPPGVPQPTFYLNTPSFSYGGSFSSVNQPMVQPQLPTPGLNYGYSNVFNSYNHQSYSGNTSGGSMTPYGSGPSQPFPLYGDDSSAMSNRNQVNDSYTFTAGTHQDNSLYSNLNTSSAFQNCSRIPSQYSQQQVQQGQLTHQACGFNAASNAPGLRGNGSTTQQPYKSSSASTQVSSLSQIFCKSTMFNLLFFLSPAHVAIFFPCELCAFESRHIEKI